MGLNVGKIWDAYDDIKEREKKNRYFLQFPIKLSREFFFLSFFSM